VAGLTGVGQDTALVTEALRQAAENDKNGGTDSPVVPDDEYRPDLLRGSR
jgi:hypothetical protein